MVTVRQSENFQRQLVFHEPVIWGLSLRTLACASLVGLLVILFSPPIFGSRLGIAIFFLVSVVLRVRDVRAAKKYEAWESDIEDRMGRKLNWNEEEKIP